MLASERKSYRTRAIRRLWGDAKKRPILEQTLGSDLAHEMAARMDTASPWAGGDTKGKEKIDFICRLNSRCSQVISVLSALSRLPSGVSFENAVTMLMMTAPNDAGRQVVSTVKENGLAAMAEARHRGVLRHGLEPAHRRSRT